MTNNNTTGDTMTKMTTQEKMDKIKAYWFADASTDLMYQWVKARHLSLIEFKMAMDLIATLERD